MMTVRFSPLSPIDRASRLTEQLWRALGEELLPAGPALNGAGYPTLNVWQDNDSFYVEAELPGLALADLDITLPEANTLRIEGQRKLPAEEGSTWLRRERADGEFARQFRLPGPVDAEGVEATLRHGVLTVKLPKTPEIRPRKIEVRSA
jgi:HSP20 family protein